LLYFFFLKKASPIFCFPPRQLFFGGFSAFLFLLQWVVYDRPSPFRFRFSIDISSLRRYPVRISEVIIYLLISVHVFLLSIGDDNRFSAFFSLPRLGRKHFLVSLKHDVAVFQGLL